MRTDNCRSGMLNLLCQIYDYQYYDYSFIVQSFVQIIEVAWEERICGKKMVCGNERRLYQKTQQNPGNAWI